MSIYSYMYFKAQPKTILLPSPYGSLSKVVTSSTIEAANREVKQLIESGNKAGKKRGSYMKYTPTDKAKVGNYAVQHGISAPLRHFKTEFPDLKWSTVHDWKQVILKEMKRCDVSQKSYRPIVELHGKRRGRPSTLSDELTEELKAYILAVRDAGGVVNTAIVMAAGTGVLRQKDPGSLECNGGTLTLKKSWAKYLLGKMNFVKRKATTRAKSMVHNFDEVKQQFLQDVSAVVTFEEIPDALIVNWDQTGINYVPVSHWTMAKEGSKRVEVAGVEDKRQITAVFAGSLSGDFLPPQLVYQGKTMKCLPSMVFPKGWDVTCTPNHWCNEETTIRYIQIIIIPYVRTTRENLGLPKTFPALMIFDEFTGQTTNQVLEFLEKNNLYYIIVPPNCTDKLQPLDLSVNKSVKEFLSSRFQEW